MFANDIIKLDREALRTAIGKIIHPVGFEENSLELKAVVDAHRNEALRKADAIIALFDILSPILLRDSEDVR